MNVVRSEWRRLMRPGMILGAGLLVALAALGAALVFGTAVADQARDGDAMAFRIARLEQPDGLVATMLLTGQLVGAVALVLFARSFGNDYSNATLKVALSREPRRGRVLGGKLVAVGLLVSVAVLLGFLAMTATASAVAAARGIDTSQWWTAEGIGESLAGLGRLVVATLVMGLVGATLGIVTRSGTLAVGIGLPAIILGEHLLQRFWSGGANWLPGIATAAFAAGGTAEWGLWPAALLTLAYAVVLSAVSAATFIRRDVA